MSAPIKNGGPAYPTPHILDANGNISWGESGMTLRDYFAAQALNHIPALLSAKDENRSFVNIAEWAYEVADAMLSARAAKP